jgi:Flp pilus assembly protein CpaB
MRRRRLRSPRLHIAAAAVLAGMAAVLLHGYLGAARATGGVGEPATVVVAASQIPRGTVLAETQLRLARMPQAYTPPGSIDAIAKAAGRVVLAGLAPHEVVTETRLARVRAGPVASLVPRGLRAFAVPTSLPDGAVIPGDRVDVVATYASGQPHSEVTAEGIEVLFVLGPSAGGSTGGGLGLDAESAGAEAATTLILLVSPDQEERLAFARAFANLEVAVEPSE